MARHTQGRGRCRRLVRHDCVLGTWFESSQPHHAVTVKRRFPETKQESTEFGGLERGAWSLGRADWIHREYFVDGVTESLTTDLSRISGSFVIARNTAFTYKGKPFDVKQIGRELNVRYVLEGSVQRGGNRLRVNVQLVDAETGAHLWAERFDKPVADLFDMQDEIVAWSPTPWAMN